MRVSFFKKMKNTSLPDSVINVIFVTLFIFILSPLLGGSDFGIFKVPQFKYPYYMSIIGLIILCILFIPMLPDQDCNEIFKDLAKELGDLRCSLSDYNMDDIVDNSIKNLRHEGLHQNPYLIYIKPFSDKFLNEQKLRNCLPADLSEKIKLLAYGKNLSVSDVLICIDKISGHKKIKDII